MRTHCISSNSLVLAFLIVIVLSFFHHSHSQSQRAYFRCLENMGISGLTYTPRNSSYLPILTASLDNRRFAPPSTPKPLAIVAPEHERHIRAVVLCSKKHGIQIRTRSGGHDFEGLSSRSSQSAPFVVLDLFKLNRITVDVNQRTAWVQGGATLGQLYYQISRVSQTLAFPGGFCPTVGVGGHMSGGGFGQLFRKYGLAADNVIDARLINANGDILDREYMGEDLFWAIRGGGGGSFGVITAWKVRLVSVPQVVSMFSINRTLEQNATELIHKWQYIAPNLPKEIYFAVTIRSVNAGGSGDKTIQATFDCIFQGGKNGLVKLFDQTFPELGVTRDDCTDLSWIRSLLLFNAYPLDESTEVLASRSPPVQRWSYKNKADYVREPITCSGLEGIWDFLYQAETGEVLFIANGGKMTEISESALPYPHRAGHLYEIMYTVAWGEGELQTSEYISWVRRLYKYMTPYVSQLPRAAYVNYRDLDLGVNDEDNTNYGQIPTWGFQYFKKNFIKLMVVKTMVDPDNFFRHEQSIPTIPFLNGKRIEGNSKLLMATS